VTIEINCNHKVLLLNTVMDKMLCLPEHAEIIIAFIKPFTKI